MKVVHLNTNARWGGGEHQVLELARGMRALGHDSVVLARPDSELFERAACVEEVELVPFAFTSRYSPLTVARLRRVLRRLDADLLHLHDGHAVAIGVPAARPLRDLGLVVHRRISSPMRRNPLSRGRYRSPRVDALIAVSASARESLLRIAVSPERTHVVPSGVDAERLRPVASQASARRAVGLADGRWIGTVGTLEPKKDVATFVRTAARLAARASDLRFLVVGDGRQREELEGLACELGLGDRIVFTGRVVDAHRHIAALDVFVFPSLREGSPGVVKEAMALGVPVVAARAPGTIEVVDEATGAVVAPGDVDAFAAAVTEVLDAPALAARRAQRARRRVEESYSIERTIERTLEVYRDVLRARRHAASETGLEPVSGGVQVLVAPSRVPPDA